MLDLPSEVSSQPGVVARVLGAGAGARAGTFQELPEFDIMLPAPLLLAPALALLCLLRHRRMQLGRCLFEPQGTCIHS